MATAKVLLLTGEIVTVPEEEMIAFLEQNRTLFQMRKFKARRPRMVEEAAVTNKQ